MAPTSQSPMIRRRPTRESDLSFVLRAERDPSHGDYVTQWSLSGHRSALVDPDIGHWIIGSSSHHTLLGYMIAVGLIEGRGRINLKRIFGTTKGLGVGRLALRAFHRKARKQYGAAEVWLIVYQRNERAQRLYRSEGYAEAGVSPSTREDTSHMIMALDLEKMGSTTILAEDHIE